MNSPISAERDYFTDHSILLDPYEYFQEMYARGPVTKMPVHDALIVTGFDEAQQVFRSKDFSSFNATVGAAYPLPFTPEGSDICDQIEAHRAEMPGTDLLVTYDDARHSDIRYIVNQLLTPTRLKANARFMESYSAQLVEQAVANRECELVNGVATPYVTLVVADLLGVPPEDRDKFRAVIDAAPPAGGLDSGDKPHHPGPLEYMAGFFAEYIQDRRANPQSDVLTQLANSTYPDGRPAELKELVSLAGFMFGAGQDTSAKLLSNAMRYIIEIPGLQRQLREDYSLIPPLLEEVLRLEGSSKVTFRVARRDTRIGDVDVPAGTRITIALGAVNRDPRRWENPNEFRLKRPRIREHLAFGRGAHTCAGSPLAREEIRVILEHFFDKTSDIQMNEEKHGTPGNRRLQYEPSFIVRGLTNLHLDLKPA